MFFEDAVCPAAMPCLGGGAAKADSLHEINSYMIVQFNCPIQTISLYEAADVHRDGGLRHAGGHFSQHVHPFVAGYSAVCRDPLYEDSESGAVAIRRHRVPSVV